MTAYSKLRALADASEQLDSHFTTNEAGEQELADVPDDVAASVVNVLLAIESVLTD